MTRWSICFEHVAGRDNVKRWAFTPTPDAWELDFDQLTQLITPHTKLIVVNFPHNPTGYLLTRDQQSKLATIVEQHGCWLFYDEMYYGLVHSGTPTIPSAADISPRTIVLSGLSKNTWVAGIAHRLASCAR